MSKLNKKGIILPVILAVVAILSVWLTVSARTSSAERKVFFDYYKSRKANYMARSAFEHTLLKLDVMRKHSPLSLALMKDADKAEKNILYSVFIQDIIIPSDGELTSMHQKYSVKSFELLSSDNASETRFLVKTEGEFAEKKVSLNRLIQAN